MDGLNLVVMKVFATVLDVLLSIMNIILYPFYAIIELFLPDVDQFFSYISDYYVIAGTYVGWSLDALLIPAGLLTLIYGFFIFRFTVQFAVWNIKRVLIWSVIIRLIGPKVI